MITNRVMAIANTASLKRIMPLELELLSGVVEYV
jgi:hypothetical protein